MKRTIPGEIKMAVLIIAILSGCSVSHKIAQQALLTLINDSIARHAHIGISIFEPSTGKYWYEHDAEKYYVPASNTKLFTLFAALTYLGDSLTGLKVSYKNGSAFILPTGDPTFLHPEYGQQRVFAFLRSLQQPVIFSSGAWKEQPLGRGWAWDDYESDDMIERSPFPIYRNVVTWTQVNDKNEGMHNEGKLVFSEPEINWKVNFSEDSSSKFFKVGRRQSENVYEITFGKEKRSVIPIPFVTNGLESALKLLKDTLGKTISTTLVLPGGPFQSIHSRPVDSLYIPMMHRSDNFFAEQTLLMAGLEKLGVMNDGQMINYLLTNDLKDLPQKPKWVDGSGLSRYNLFTPEDFVFVLNKMKKDFGLERFKTILPTGGTGTLSSLYKKDSGYIFAKTGTLSNNVALSGFLVTKKDKLLIFSILVNDFQGGATPVRKAIEKFLSNIRQHY